MFFKEGKLADAKQEAEWARFMSEEMGYFWGKVDAQEVLTRLNNSTS